MQQTRLTGLFGSFTSRTRLLFNNPWRKISLILISLLLGIFMGSAISTTAGQAAYWDVTVAAILLLFTELASKFIYSRRPINEEAFTRSNLWLDVLNVFKIGLIYSFYLEALKLGS